MPDPVQIVTSLADPHRPGGRLDEISLQAHLTRYALIFDQVVVPDAQVLANPVLWRLLLRIDGSNDVLNKLVSDRVLRIGLRSQLESLEQLWLLQSEKNVEGLPTREQARRLDALTTFRFEDYDGPRVADIFRERVLDGLGSFPVGQGGVARRELDQLESFVASIPNINLKQLHDHVSGWTNVAPKSKDRLLQVLNAAYANNVALATESNFDGFFGQGADRAVSVERWELPPILSVLNSADLLASLSIDTVQRFRETRAFSEVVEATEAWRLGAHGETSRLLAAFESMATVLDGFVAVEADPAVRSRLSAIKRSKRRTELAYFLVGTGIAVAGLRPSLASGSFALGLAMSSLGALKDRTFEDSYRIIDAVASPSNHSMMPVTSGKVALELVRKDNKSGGHL